MSGDNVRYGLSSDSQSVYCYRCGAVVVDEIAVKSLHTEWHAKEPQRIRVHSGMQVIGGGYGDE